ncbi:MAG: hypothetical protein LBU34_07290 [Planctomycetaceae bacterium]|nr:hypothetical protein [Planctomycetaceae bacterium]
MHITPLAGLRFRLPCENKNLSANTDATVRRQISQSANADAIARRAIAYPKSHKGRDVHNRRWSAAQPPDYNPKKHKPRTGRDYQPTQE